MNIIMRVRRSLGEVGKNFKNISLLMLLATASMVQLHGMEEAEMQEQNMQKQDAAKTAAQKASTSYQMPNLGIKSTLNSAGTGLAKVTGYQSEANKNGWTFNGLMKNNKPILAGDAPAQSEEANASFDNLSEQETQNNIPQAVSLAGRYPIAKSEITRARATINSYSNSGQKNTAYGAEISGAKDSALSESSARKQALANRTSRLASSGQNVDNANNQSLTVYNPDFAKQQRSTMSLSQQANLAVKNAYTGSGARAVVNAPGRAVNYASGERLDSSFITGNGTNGGSLRSGASYVGSGIASGARTAGRIASSPFKETSIPSPDTKEVAEFKNKAGNTTTTSPDGNVETITDKQGNRLVTTKNVDGTETSTYTAAQWVNLPSRTLRALAKLPNTLAGRKTAGETGAVAAAKAAGAEPTSEDQAPVNAILADETEKNETAAVTGQNVFSRVYQYLTGKSKSSSPVDESLPNKKNMDIGIVHPLNDNEDDTETL